MIEVRGLEKRLGKTDILKSVTFTAPSGEVTALLGPNGAGKTTTMRVLATMLRPDEGTVFVDGASVTDDPHLVRQRIGLVTEEPGLFERLTPREQLRFVASVHGLGTADADARIDELAEQFGLSANVDRRAGELSKGNRQKVALARALVHDPPVLLLDEPTANLDVVASAALETILLAPGAMTGRTVLLSTHSIEEADRLATRVVGLAEGRVVVDGTKAELTERFGAADFREAFIRLLAQTTLTSSPEP